MELDQTLRLLREHGVGAASFDPSGKLLSVTFGVVVPPSGSGDGDGDGDNEDAPGWRTKMHLAASVLQGRERSMREDSDA